MEESLKVLPETGVVEERYLPVTIEVKGAT